LCTAAPSNGTIRGHQHGDARIPISLCATSSVVAGLCNQDQHLLAGMLGAVEQLAQRVEIARTGQSYAYRRRRQRRSLPLSFNDDRHLVLRLRFRRGPEAHSRNTEAAGMRRLRQVMPLRAAYVSSVKYQLFRIRVVLMAFYRRPASALSTSSGPARVFARS